MSAGEGHIGLNAYRATYLESETVLCGGENLNAGHDVVAVLPDIPDAITYRRITAQPTMAVGRIDVRAFAQALWFTPWHALPKRVLVVTRGAQDEDFSEVIGDLLDAAGIRHITVPFPPTPTPPSAEGGCDDRI